jgi:PhzF family phenazine biosynthesis protein
VYGRVVQLFHVDTFTDTLFQGNAAAVCPLERWMPDPLLQAIATENNVSETAFFVRQGPHFALRWFTPTQEVPFCGHATLASAFVLRRQLGFPDPVMTFQTTIGSLIVTEKNHRFTLDTPAIATVKLSMPPDGLVEALGLEAVEYLRDDVNPNYYAIVGGIEQLQSLKPDMARLAEFHPFGVGVSAEGDAHEIAARYFAPSYGMPEDPVTGSMFSALVPYWAGRMGVQRMAGRQYSARGGQLDCALIGDRVHLTGDARLYFQGTIFLP